MLVLNPPRNTLRGAGGSAAGSDVGTGTGIAIVGSAMVLFMPTTPCTTTQWQEQDARSFKASRGGVRKNKSISHARMVP